MVFDASLARKSWRETRERWEKKRVERLERVTTAVRGYFEDRPVRAVYVAGSLTRPGAFRPGSDIDIAVEGLPRQSYSPSSTDLQEILGTDWVDLIAGHGNAQVAQTRYDAEGTPVSIEFLDAAERQLVDPSAISVTMLAQKDTKQSAA